MRPLGIGHPVLRSPTRVRLRQGRRRDPIDGIHLGAAVTLDEPIVSTDTLYRDVDDLEHVDPRNLESGDD